jgi:hypothetical protein
MEAIDPKWRKATYSGNGGNCVEVGQSPGRVLVRDTTDPEGAVLRFSPDAWHELTAQLRK